MPLCLSLSLVMSVLSAAAWRGRASCTLCIASKPRTLCIPSSCPPHACPEVQEIRGIHFPFFSHPPIPISARASRPGSVVQRPHPPLSGLELAPPSLGTAPPRALTCPSFLGKLARLSPSPAGLYSPAIACELQRSRRPFGALYLSALFGRCQVLDPPTYSLA